MKKLLSILLVALSIASCSKKDGDIQQPNAEKKVRVEVEFSGDYQNYQLLFTINSLTKGKGEFVEPVITTPAAAQWTQVIAQGNAYNYIADLTTPKLVVESKEAVNRLGFLLSATQTKNTDAVNQTPISAVIKVYADDKVIETYNYKALPLGQVTQPVSKSLDISAY
jgi:hypothetical protein